MAGGSVPSQLEAFKFKTKQNNPFLGSFFTSSIFVRSPTSPERSGSQNPESKCLRASFALLNRLGCSGKEAAFIVSGVTSCGGQQNPRPWGYNSQASLGQQKEALTYFKAVSWGQGFLSDHGWPARDWALFDFLLAACSWAPCLTEQACRAIRTPRGSHTTPHHAKASSWGGKCSEAPSGVSMTATSTASLIREMEVGQDP